MVHCSHIHTLKSKNTQNLDFVCFLLLESRSMINVPLATDESDDAPDSDSMEITARQS